LITSSVFLPESIVRSWTLRIMHRMIRWLSFDQFMYLLDCTHIIKSSFSFSAWNYRASCCRRSGKLIQYWPPRWAPYIGHKAPSISSLMKVPKTNPVPDNLPLSTLKRKGDSSKTLAPNSKRKIDTWVVDASRY
jgi:hypothetical protein